MAIETQVLREWTNAEHNLKTAEDFALCNRQWINDHDCENFHDIQHDKNLGNLKTAEDSAAVGDGANSAGKSKKADAGKDVAVDELPRGS